jgi:hypothetical protein
MRTYRQKTAQMWICRGCCMRTFSGEGKLSP